MPLPATDFWTWVRHHLLLSNGRQAWEDRAGLFTLLVGFLGLTWLGRELPLSRQVLLWLGLLVVLAVLFRRGWLRLFGPVLFYEFVRVARRDRYFLLRFLYTLALGLLVFWFYWVFSLQAQFAGAGTMTLRDQAYFAEAFFYTFMWVQFLVVVVLTPAYTASAIADEKDRRTLEFLLATDLQNREIVLGKWTARVGNLTLLLLAGVPVLAMNLFLGGVDPDLLIAGFAATGITLLSLAGVSILTSVYAKRARDAIVLSYLILAAYYVLSSVGSSLALAFPAFGSQGITLGSFSLTVADVMQGLATGNIFIALLDLMRQVAFGGGLANSLPRVLREYAVFHGLLTLFTVGLAVLRLRAVAVKQQAVVKARRRGVRGWKRPPVGHYPPMIWKEVFADAGQRMNVFGTLVVLLLVGASFVPFLLIVYFFFEGAFTGRGGFYSGNSNRFGEAVNAWVRIAGMLVACLTILGVGVRAAGSIRGERDKQTLEGLLTTPLTSTEMLVGKWLGSLSSGRWGLLWICLIWLIGAAVGGLHPLLLILLVLAWLVYAGVVAVIGLWFSIVSRTTLRATVWTVVTTIGCAIGHWFLWSCCMPLFFVSRFPGAGFDKLMQVVVKVQMSLSPPVVFAGMLPWRAEDFNRDYGVRNEFSPVSLLAYALFGLVVWALLGAGLWAAASTRFRRLTGREPRTPERSRAPRPEQPRPRREADPPEG